MPSIHINLIDVFNNVSMNLKIFGERALAKRRYEKKPMKANIFVPQIINTVVSQLLLRSLISKYAKVNKNYPYDISI